MDSRISKPVLELVESRLTSTDEPYQELFVTLGMLRHLYLVHQTNHWIASGDVFYGDHLLFQRLYELPVGQIDQVAEKAVGLGSANLVNLHDQLEFVNDIQKSYGHKAYSLPHPGVLVESSLSAEVTFIHTMKLICSSLKESGLMTHGLDNLLAGIEDTHEGSVYLLKQRSSQVFLP